ncbi:hypothetical protein [Sulfurimonas sp. HSL-1716]|uniref:hypothetical protein n=1 Tax=Hydrocurvibacter sulfurireducens TaxID=3131937 RepID=UPI0031F779FC
MGDIKTYLETETQSAVTQLEDEVALIEQGVQANADAAAQSAAYAQAYAQSINPDILATKSELNDTKVMSRSGVLGKPIFSLSNSEVSAASLVVSYSNGVGTTGMDNSVENVGNITFASTNLVSGVKNYTYKLYGDNTLYGTKYEPQYDQFFGFGSCFSPKTRKWYKANFQDSFDSSASLANYTGILYGDSYSALYGGSLKLDSSGQSNHWVNFAVATAIGQRYKLVFKFYPGTAVTNKISIGGGTGYQSDILNQGDSNTIQGGYEFTANNVSTSVSMYSSTGGDQYYTDFYLVPINADGTLNIDKAVALDPQPAYLPITVDVDANGSITNIDDYDVPTLAEDYMIVNRLKVLGNRKILDIGTISVNNTYYIDNPFGNDKYESCDVKLEIQIGGVWAEPGWTIDSGNNSRGAKAFSKADGIEVLTASYQLKGSTDNLYGHGFDSDVSTATSAAARIIVTYEGETKNV